ncbi:hypothetical protein HPG69_014753 [Diceros bicornis minor]|uniref:Testicular haploid expressed gene protein n=1 Tax=Diceros bicornis minor TaxID=77932 RepID=A0A7J7EIC5_DICBM|nr:hypothetical protein HPG69_014753 [Diceros bicornis minor]
MGDHWPSSLHNPRGSKAEGRSEEGQDDDALGPRSTAYESRGSKDPDGREQGSPDQEEEVPPEEVTGEAFLDPQDPEDALQELERVLQKDEDGVQEMRPSTYWTDRFLEDTTLTVTVPALSGSPVPLGESRFSSRESKTQQDSALLNLSTPQEETNVSQVSRAAQKAVPSPRILQLAKPRAAAPLLAEWDPVLKPKPYVSDYSRLVHLAMPKAQSDKCVPDRDPRWEVLDVTKRAVASPRIVSLAQPKVRRDLNEGYDPHSISPASLVARASPRLCELATPKSITRKV